jgi:hypothetical protein
MKIWPALLIFSVLGTASLAAPGGPASAAVASMEHKLRHIENNGSQARPDPTPTDFMENEVNAYFASGQMDLPAGVESVRFQSEPGVVTADTRVDFDRLKGGTGSLNPLLAIFAGIHDVVVVAHAHGAGGTGFVHIDSVSLDEIEIPRFALQLFVEKYLQPQYPDIGLDSRFKLPNRIQSASAGEHKLTVTQK